MPMTPPIEPARVTSYRTGDGLVTFASPADPWTVGLGIEFDGGRARIGTLRIEVRDPGATVTPRRLAALPLRHLLHVAAVEQTPGSYPNEAYMRMLARPKPGGGWWDDGHWARVLAVHAWGREVGWPGGPSQAVADLWGVAADSTVKRWLAKARRRQGVTDQTSADA